MKKNKARTVIVDEIIGETVDGLWPDIKVPKTGTFYVVVAFSDSDWASNDFGFLGFFNGKEVMRQQCGKIDSAYECAKAWKKRFITNGQKNTDEDEKLFRTWLKVTKPKK